MYLKLKLSEVGRLFTLLYVFLALQHSSFATCPSGQIAKSGSVFNATIVDDHAHDPDRALGAPNGTFAKIDKTSEYIIFKLNQTLNAGDSIRLYFSSYGAGITKALIYAGEYHTNLNYSATVQTSITDESDVAAIAFGGDVNYIKITLPNESGLEDLLIDALGAHTEVCFTDPNLTLTSKHCQSPSINICIDDLVNIDSFYGASPSYLAVGSYNGVGQALISTVESSDVSCCDLGKPVELTFTYQQSSVVDNNQGDKSSVTSYQTGENKVLIVVNDNSGATDLSDPYFSQIIQIGESFTIDQSNGSWGSNMYIHVMDTSGSTAIQLVGFHTSCSAPIVAGDRFGYLQLNSTVSEDGQFCGTDPNECYNTLVYQPKVHTNTRDTVSLRVCFEDQGATFCDDVPVIINLTDTSCSPVVTLNTNACSSLPLTFCLEGLINIDSLLGTDNYTVSGTSDAYNGQISLPMSGNTSNEDCCDFGKPTKLIFQYTFDNVIDNNQPSGKSSVTTYDNSNGQKVYVVANGNSNPTDLSDPYFSGVVKPGDLFTLTQDNGSWSSNTYFHILDSTGTDVIQLVQFHTSCSAPVVPGDRFGYLTLKQTIIDGSTCGTIENDSCTEVVYFPPDKFSGTDAIDLEVCSVNNGQTVCQTIRIEVSVSDSVCAPYCEEKETLTYVNSNASRVQNGEGHDLTNIIGAVDGDFSKLEDDGDFVEVVLENTLLSGSQLDIVTASYGGKEASALLEVSYDGVNWLSSNEIITTSEKPDTETKSYEFGFDINYVRIVYDDINSQDKLLIDALSFEGGYCYKDFPDTIVLRSCIDEITTWDLDEILGEGENITDYTLSVVTQPMNGQLTVESEYDLVGCEIERPEILTMRMLDKGCSLSENTQENDFDCIDYKDISQYSSLKIIVNDESDINKRITDNDQYFNGQVAIGNRFNIDASLDGKSELPSKVYVWLMDSATNEVVQSLKIKTDCNKPINLFDQFGALTLEKFVAKDEKGEIEVPAAAFESTYTPSTGFAGYDEVALKLCRVDYDSICQTIVYQLDINNVSPVAVNDTMEELDATSGISETLIRVLLNDSHPYDEQIKIYEPSLINPTLSGASVRFDSIEQTLTYIIDGPVDGDIDSFAYVIASECSYDTAWVYVAFGGAVPVTWLDFNVWKHNQNDVRLEWATASEENNSHFEIERSFDGVQFVKIGDDVLGAGTTSEISEYFSWDYDLPNGAVYYRIKQIDFDGQFDYSVSRVVYINGKADILVFPNPAHDQIHVRFEVGKGNEVNLLNYTGQVLVTTQINRNGKAVFQTNDYPQGVYFVEIKSAIGSQVKKVIIKK